MLKILKVRRVATNDQDHSVSCYTKGIRSIIETLQFILGRDQAVLLATTCHIDVSFCMTDWSDAGWGCGYRNVQTILSSLMVIYDGFYDRAFGKSAILNIAEIQAGIEQAWSHGYDIEGAAQLKWKLSGTRKWIGTTEVYAFLTSLGLDCSVIQFEGASHVKKLMQFSEQYFNAKHNVTGHDVTSSTTVPLYFQHQGHSRTIVGFVKTQEGPALLVLDPARRVVSDMRKLMRNMSAAHEGLPGHDITSGTEWPWHKLLKDYLVTEKLLKKKQYQLLRVNGLLTASQGQTRKVIRPLVP